MRVCFISHQYSPAAGGIGRLTASLAGGMVAGGHDVHVVSCGAYGTESHAAEGGVHVHRLPEAMPLPPILQPELGSADVARLSIVYREVMRLHRESAFDIVSSPLWLGEGLLAALDPSLPCVLWLQTETRTLIEIDAFWRTLPRAQTLVALEQQAVAAARHTHASSRAILAQVTADYGAPSGAFIVAHGVPDLAGNREARQPTPTVRLLVVGWLDIRKGGDRLVEVLPPLLERHPELEVALVGQAVSIAEIGHRTVEQAIDGRCPGRPDLLGRIAFLGRVTDAELVRQYGLADILLFPTRHESFGLPLIEAMSFGIPSVASAVTAIPEIVVDGKDGILVTDGDCDGLTEAVSSLVRDPERRRRMGEAARASYLGKFSLATSVPRTLAAYRDAAAAERKRARVANAFDPVAALAAVFEATTSLRRDVATEAAATLLGQAPAPPPALPAVSWFDRTSRILRHRAARLLPRARRQASAIVWLSHADAQCNPAFHRLQREASHYGHVLSAGHGAPSPYGIGDAALSAALPSRSRERSQRGAELYEMLDLLHVAVALRLREFEHIWFVEYDVDFSGDWGRLFAAFTDCRADLLGTTLYPRIPDAGWPHWPIFRGPAHIAVDQQWRGFFPILRVSRPFVSAYAEEVARGWAGHFEALYPTIATHRGLAVEDIGGTGPLAPPARRGRFYANTAGHPWLLPGTVRFRPAAAARNFVPGAGGFPQPDVLWHPVKPLHSPPA